MNNLEYEIKKLQEILIEYNKVIDSSNRMLGRLPELHRGDPILLNQLIKIYSNKLKLMKEGLNKPYFARIDFKNGSDNKLSQCYIGKVGVSNLKNEIVTVDWRAPIASLYYDSNVGKTSYEAPIGTVSGELLVKKQIDIENGEIQQVVDIDTVSNDELLKPYLGVTADSRLKNIVSTIQVEQNKIIRDDIKKNLIIQGVAGSGKTTVALHRIAYLIYNNQKSINPDQYMVIGPSNFFLDYISTVLPDLDAATVEQLTFEKFILNYIEEDLSIKSSQRQLKDILENNTNSQVYKIKNSSRYQKLIDLYLEKLNDKIVPSKDFAIKGVRILPSEVIRGLYNEIDKSKYPTLTSRIERCVLLTSSYIKNTPGLEKEIDSKAFASDAKTREAIRKELRNGFKQTLKQYMSTIAKKKTSSIYMDFIKNIDTLSTDLDRNELVKLKKETMALFKENNLEFDDLSALGYIKYKIGGNDEYKKYRHTVIDEAQDYGDFSFSVMKNIMANSTFSIYGDIAQSIYDYRSIESWEEAADVFQGNIEKIELLKSYRTTIEIMETANKITKHISIPTAQPVIRNGNKVDYHQFESNESQTDIIIDCLLKYKENGRKSIAIITKSEEATKDICVQLQNKGIPTECMVEQNDKYSGGICVTTAQLSKGLEFDSVIIANADETTYKSDNNIDMKLLYVAMTRPLHDLDILHKDNMTSPLAQFLVTEPTKKQDKKMIK